MMFEESLAVKDTLRRTLARLWAASLRPVYERTILVLTILFCIALLGSIWHLQRLYTNLVESTALDEAARYTDALAEFRILYTREVVETVRAQDIVVTHDYDRGDNKGKAIPLPATLSMLIGNRMAQKELGGQTALYSGYPFPWREKEWQRRDQFAKDAWEAVTKNPDEAFYRTENHDGRRWLRYATADVMRQACVECHNTHADSPKRDWKEGDVRGVLEVSLPLETAIVLTRQSLQGELMLMAIVGVAGLSSLAIAIGRLRRNQTELVDRVQERTATLAKANTELETEVDERKQVEQALRMSEERFHKIFEHSNDAIFLVDPSADEILDVNSMACRMLKYSRDELLSVTMSAIHPHEMPRLLAFAESVFQEGSGWTDELTCTTKMNEVVPAEISASVIEIGSKTYLLALVREITERKQAERRIQQLNADLEQRVDERTRQLAAANRELEAFSYSVSHDLRAPLRRIDGFSLAVLDNYGEKLDDQGKHFLERMRIGVQHMGQLIDALLNLSRMTAVELQKQPVDLSALAASILDACRTENPGHEVEVTIAEGLVADGDPDLLQVVLQNLLRNAWKFTEHQPHACIEFGTTKLDGETPFFVRDNGAGFSMASADKLFGPFQRLHAQSEFEGIGIGLATVQRMIHRHHGRVWAVGAVDEGATFYFTLP